MICNASQCELKLRWGRYYMNKRPENRYLSAIFFCHISVRKIPIRVVPKVQGALTLSGGEKAAERSTASRRLRRSDSVAGRILHLLAAILPLT